MPQVCLYLQLHQPFRLEPFSVFDVGNRQNYFAGIEDKNRQVFQKVAQKSYLPMLTLLKKLATQHPEFVLALSASGVWLEQAAQFQPEVIELLQALAKTYQVEFLAETYYHSLASLYSPAEFGAQVRLHTQKIEQLFGQTPRVFRNTELIYSNDIAKLVHDLGFQGMLAEAVPRFLGDRSKTFGYIDFSRQLPLLLKHAELSDDLAFRFSDRSWKHFPLHADTFIGWLKSYKQEEMINLFMDFETFGEHQWQDTGIFEFFAEMVRQVNADQYSAFKTPSELLFKKPGLQIYDVPEPISWADVDRDLTAWRGNELQWDTLRLIYDLEKEVLATADEKLIDNWRKLQISDHFYYMCTKWSADGDVHAYFSPYDSALEAYNRYCNVVADLKGRLGLPNQNKTSGFSQSKNVWF